MNRTTTTMILGVAMSGLLTGTAARLQAAPTAPSSTLVSADKAGLLMADTPQEKHSCKGQNTCKGKGGCKSGDNGCKGKNSCKGKGGCQTNA